MLSAFLTEVGGGDGGTLASHCRDLNKIYCPELQQADGGAIAGVFLLQKEQEACDFRRLRLTSDTELAVGEGRERKEKKKRQRDVEGRHVGEWINEAPALWQYSRAVFLTLHCCWAVSEFLIRFFPFSGDCWNLWVSVANETVAWTDVRSTFTLLALKAQWVTFKGVYWHVMGQKYIS